MNNIQINTSQNVNIDFSLASIGNRILAFVIDLVIKTAYGLIIYFLIVKVLGLGSVFARLDQYSLMAIFIILSAPVMFYTLFLESMMEGQTFGKKIAKIKVIKVDGYQASFSDYLIRWFFMPIDIYFSSALIGVVSMLTSKSSQRLGGIASGTAVINLENKIKIHHTILQETDNSYQVSYPNVILLNDRDMQIIKTQYLEAIKRKDYIVLGKLAQKIKEITQITETSQNHRDFVKTIIADYNYLTGKER